jgi:hypothetical protein
MKLRKLKNSDPLASLGDSLGITLYQRESDGKIVYKKKNGTVVEVMDGESTTITTLESDVDTLQTDVTNLQANAGYTYTEVAVTSANILAKDTITVLPAPGANKYYDIEKVIFEYNYGTIAYVNQNPQGIYLNQGRDFIIVHGDIIEGTQDTVAIARPHAPYNTDVSVGDQQNPIEYFWLNEAVVMDYYDGGTITNGDGTLLLKVWYKIKTFGTEL